MKSLSTPSALLTSRKRLQQSSKTDSLNRVIANLDEPCIAIRAFVLARRASKINGKKTDHSDTSPLRCWQIFFLNSFIKRQHSKCKICILTDRVPCFETRHFTKTTARFFSLRRRRQQQHVLSLGQVRIRIPCNGGIQA